jgi:hypothetical protein
MKGTDWFAHTGAWSRLFAKGKAGETAPVPFQQMVVDEARAALDRFGLDRRGYELKVVELPPHPGGQDHCVVYVKLRPVAVIVEALARFEATLHSQLAAYGIVVRAVYWRVHAS